MQRAPNAVWSRGLLRAAWCLALLVALSLLAASCASVAADTAGAAQCDVATSTGVDADEVRRLEARGAQANVEGWSREEARAFFAPSWVSVGPDGAVRGVDQVFATFVDGRSRPWATSFELIELDVRVYCDMAVVIGVAEARGSAPEQTARFRYLNIWRKVDGRWLYSEQQYVRL